MKQSLLLFLSMLLLLFSLHKSNTQPVARSMVQGIVAEACSHASPGLKKPCAKKCIRHQNQSAPKGCATTATDCSQQAYGLAPATEQHLLYTSYDVRVTINAEFSKPLSPFLETEHAPPQPS